MALAELYDEIFAYAKEYIRANSNYNPYVLKDTPEDGELFPLVIIREYKDTLYSENLKKTEQKEYLIYEIEVFSNDNQTARQEIVKELVGLVNEVFENNLGFRRTENRPIPYIRDNVSRQYMLFKAIYDKEQHKIYRY